MIRLIVNCVIVIAFPFCCQAQLSGGLTYWQKHGFIIDKSAKYPEESKLADTLFRLTERSITLSDSLVDGMMRSGGQTPFSFFSTDPKTEKFFNMVKDLYSMALHGIEGGKSRERINTKLVELAGIKECRTWTEKLFKDKSTIESLAELRELQTACLQLTDLAFDEIIDRKRIE